MSQQFDISLYNDEFFEWHWKHAREYSIASMEWFLRSPHAILDNYAYIHSMADFGCGIGSYLEAAFNVGLQNIRGYDIGGKHAAKYTPDHIKRFVKYLDCTKPIKLFREYDLVISFETAEHIEPSGTDIFVDNLVKAMAHSGILMFTGAPEEQEGCGHINGRPKEFWQQQFENRGLIFNNYLTSVLNAHWPDFNVPKYILDNLLVYTKP